METYYQLMRELHIAAGMLAFFVAPVALATQKGGKAHRRWGGVFFWAMAVMAVSALAITLYRPNPFLQLVAIFSFHLALTGYRAVTRRKAVNSVASHRIDLTINAIATLAYLGLAGFGIRLLLASSQNAFGYISLVFAFIGFRFVITELKHVLQPSPDKMAWWYRHMRGMLGSYIGCLSAFSAVNFRFLPDLIRWLWPTLLGLPLLILWERYYRRKFAQSKPTTA